jgi:D-3-phosphoglycerate dehydrogenase / 2-oxoglutarate reductase
MPHVVCLRPLHPDAMARLRAEPGYTVTMLDPVTPETLAEPMKTADAIIVRATRIDRAFLAIAPRLSICARHGVGYDAVDVEALTERGIPLTVTPDANAVSVAEHALMLMLTTARRTIDYDRNTKALDWGPKPSLRTLRPRRHDGAGGGLRAHRRARRQALRRLRDERLVHDPYIPQNTIKGAGFTPVKVLHEGLAQADIVTTHCPSNPETRGMVNATFLAAMKPGAAYINTARGTLVDEAALTNALRSGHLGAAGLDVFWEEPVTTKLPFLDFPNVVVSPHSAAATEQSTRRMGLSCAESIFAHFKGQLDPDVVINKEVLRGNA